MNAGCGAAIYTVFSVSPESLQDLPAYTNAVPVEDSVQLRIESRIFLSWRYPHMLFWPPHQWTLFKILSQNFIVAALKHAFSQTGKFEIYEVDTKVRHFTS